MQEIKQQVKNYIVDNFFLSSAEALRDDTSLLSEKILDSTAVLEIVSYLESSFGVEVADDEIIPENLDSLDAIAAYIERKRGRARGGDRAPA